MSFLASLGEQALFAVVTQGIGATISGIQSAQNDYDQDMQTCDSYNQTLQTTQDLKQLTSDIANKSVTQLADNQTFMKVNAAIKNMQLGMASKSKTFSTRVMVTIIVNIVLVMLLAYNMFLKTK